MLTTFDGCASIKSFVAPAEAERVSSVLGYLRVSEAGVILMNLDAPDHSGVQRLSTVRIHSEISYELKKTPTAWAFFGTSGDSRDTKDGS